MNCQEARALIVDGLAGEENPSLAVDLKTHLEACPTCRSLRDEYVDLWQNMARLPQPVLPPDRADAMLAQIQQDAAASLGADSPHGVATRRWYRPLAAVAALLLATLCGAIASRSNAALRLFPMASASPEPRPLLATDSTGGTFLFLLHRPEEFRVPGREARYRQWADQLRERNLLVRANGLQAGWGWTLTREDGAMRAAPMAAPAGDIEGFFLIAARDSSDVLAAARLSPHFDYGGIIEVRRVVP
jgi:hypothetical protein